MHQPLSYLGSCFKHRAKQTPCHFVASATSGNTRSEFVWRVPFSELWEALVSYNFCLWIQFVTVMSSLEFGEGCVKSCCCCTSTSSNFRWTSEIILVSVCSCLLFSIAMLSAKLPLPALDFSIKTYNDDEGSINFVVCFVYNYNDALKIYLQISSTSKQ